MSGVLVFASCACAIGVAAEAVGPTVVLDFSLGIEVELCDSFAVTLGDSCVASCLGGELGGSNFIRSIEELFKSSEGLLGAVELSPILHCIGEQATVI